MIAFAKNSDIQKWFEAKNMSRSNSTQNKREGYPYEDADFYPKYQEVCQICGITSFAHRHKAGSKPKDFERLPEASKTKERASGEDIPKWSERLQKAYDQGYADARREVYEKGYQDGFDRKPRQISDSAHEYQKKLATLREEETK